MRPEDTALTEIAAIVAKEVLEGFISGRLVSFERLDMGVSAIEPTQVAAFMAGTQAAKAGFSIKSSREVARRASRLVDERIDEIERLVSKGIRIAGVKITPYGQLELDLKTKKREGVPSDVKQEMADMARAGVTVQDIAEQYGYQPLDVRKILKSVKIVAPERPELPAPVDDGPTRDLGVTGLDADLELTIAEALMSGAAPEEVVDDTGATQEQIEAVRAAWADASPTEAAAEAIAYQRERKAETKEEEELDPTSEGEVLFYAGAGPDGFRVEIPPQLVGRLTKELEALRRLTVHGSSTTEYDIVLSNIRRFADRNLPATDRRFKVFQWRGHRIQEFKGFQARVFAGAMRSVYPDGREVWRCGLIHCIVKKRDDTKESDLEKAVELLDAWRAWREQQDAKIAEDMR